MQESKKLTTVTLTSSSQNKRHKVKDEAEKVVNVIRKKKKAAKEKVVIPEPKPKLKIGDRVRMHDGKAIGSIDNIANEASIKRIINIKLFNDMSSLKNIYVVKDFDKQQLMNLEKTSNE